MLFQIDIKQDSNYVEWSDSLRVMLFQIDIKLILSTMRFTNEFESNVILDRYKTKKVLCW